MKAYSGTWCGRERVAVAAKNQKDAARLFRVSLYEFRNYYHQGADPLVIDRLFAAPGIVFRKPLGRGEWTANPSFPSRG